MLYNEDGEALGVNCHSELEGVNKSSTFLFVKDAQGNVVSISALEGGYFFNLSYDSFGNPSLEVTGSEVDKIQQSIADAKTQLEKILLQISGALGIALVTGITFMCVPTTYRGYMYDMETGLYYCQSRYYSPEWGRFLNLDDVEILEVTKGETSGANLFAYCNNDPVNNLDTSGLLTIPRSVLSLGLDIILTLVVPYFSGPLDVFGRGLKYYASRRNFTLVWEKLLYGAVPKFKGLFSRAFTGIRTAIWRVTGSWISNSLTSSMSYGISRFVNCFRSSSWNRAWDIASCFFSAGSMIAGLLDFLDGRFDGKCRIW